MPRTIVRMDREPCSAPLSEISVSIRKLRSKLLAFSFHVAHELPELRDRRIFLSHGSRANRVWERNPFSADSRSHYSQWKETGARTFIDSRGTPGSGAPRYPVVTIEHQPQGCGARLDSASRSAPAPTFLSTGRRRTLPRPPLLPPPCLPIARNCTLKPRNQSSLLVRWSRPRRQPRPRRSGMPGFSDA